ncbi:MAG: cation-translocating P-type ATPase [Candidatus Altimarinota bacterium]
MKKSHQSKQSNHPTEKIEQHPSNSKNYQFHDIFETFESSEKGLDLNEVTFRQKKYGPNKLEVHKKKPLFIQIAEEFKDIMVIILILAATFALLTHEVTDAIIIYIVVLINGMIGFIQKNKAEKAIEALQKMVSPMARVLRNQHQLNIPTEEVVPGDILILNEGDSISADAILFEGNELQTSEAVLTGESTPVSKLVFSAYEKGAVTQEANLLFTGTSVTHGNGKALVIKTGKETEFGKIASLTQQTKKDLSPLEKEIKQIGLFTAKVTLGITSIILISQLIFSKNSLVETILFAVSIAVAAVPEGLPATITIALALGVQRLAKKNAIMRQLSSVETLGSTTVICSDKTGTLTKNEMTVKVAYLDDLYLSFEGAGYQPLGKISIVNKKSEQFDYDSTHSQLENLHRYIQADPNSGHALEMASLVSIFCNNSELVNQSDQLKLLGDPTEGALLTMAEKIGFSRVELSQNFQKVLEIPFDSNRKLMTQIIQNLQNGKYYVLVKGAPEKILELCDQRMSRGKASILTKSIRSELIDLNEELASQAYRTIGLAFKEMTAKQIQEVLNLANHQDKIDKLENKLVLIGLTGIIDPPRPEVKAAVQLTHQAGIRTYILTGDHGLTASAIAKQLGLVSDKKPFEVITGEQLLALNDDELKEKLGNKNLDIIFARINPFDKLRIVSALKDLGEVVAVTGDGVNDAPALKRADIGVAMGITGTDVTKEAANMVLADDSFSSIVSAIKEGRTIYENLKKFIFYIFSSNIGEVFTIFISIIIGLPAPLTAALILTINLATDLFPALALGVEKSENTIMDEAPRDPKSKIMSAPFIKRFVLIGCSIGVIMVGLYAYKLFSSGWMYGQPIGEELFRQASSITFAAMVLIQITNAFNAKSSTKSIIHSKILDNPRLLWALLSSLLIGLAVVELPFLQTYFETASLSMFDWVLVTIASLLIIVVEEIRKFVVRIKAKSSHHSKHARTSHS